MRFTAEQKDMASAVKIASAAVARAPHTPILNCLVIDAMDGLAVTGTNMDHSVRASCAASVADRGSVAVNAEDLSKWLGAVSGLIHASSDERGLTLTAGRARVVLPVLPVGDFPVAADLSGKSGAEVAGGVDAYRACLPFAEKPNSARFYLEGVFFDGTHAVATNGTRLCATEAASDATGIVPANAAALIPSGKSARLFVGGSSWRCEHDGVVATGKLLDGSFPPWRAAVGSVDYFGTVDADELAAAVQAATLAGAALEVHLSGSSDGITVSGARWAGAVNDTAVSVAYDGPDFFAAFAVSVIAPVIAAMSGRVADIGHNGRAIAMTSSGAALCVAYPLMHLRSHMPPQKVSA